MDRTISRKTTETSIREGDILVVTSTTTTLKPAVVDYADILKATSITPDEYADKPWDNQCGYEHEPHWRPSRYSDVNLSEKRGFCYADRDAVLIELKEDFESEFKFYRNLGCSIQVARENVALLRQRTLDQLVKWYSDGWTYWVVSCEFDGHNASVGGVDDFDYAVKEVKSEIASEIVGELEDEGFTITNKPEPRNYLPGRNWTADDQRHLYRRNIHMFDLDTPKANIIHNTGFMKWAQTHKV
jgi:hypothetical protein